MTPEAIEFSRIFGGFEYAMKRSGFVQNGAVGSSAKANWDTFGQALGEELFAGIAALDPPSPMISDPPRRLAIQANGPPQWQPRIGQVATTAQLIQSVRDARNNLFHGEKHGTDRDELLLRAGLGVLEAAKAIAEGAEGAQMDAFRHFLAESLAWSAPPHDAE